MAKKLRLDTNFRAGLDAVVDRLEARLLAKASAMIGRSPSEIEALLRIEVDVAVAELAKRRADTIEQLNATEH